MLLHTHVQDAQATNSGLTVIVKTSDTDASGSFIPAAGPGEAPLHLLMML